MAEMVWASIVSELPQDPSKLDITTWLANHWAKTGANASLTPYHMIEQLMSHGYKPGTQDTKGVDNAANISTMLMGSGASNAKPGLGVFGGKPRLNTESPGEAMNWLQSKRPVNEAWVRNWAKEAEVPVSHVIGNKTRYLQLKPENPPIPGRNENLTIRLPQDEERHLATSIKPMRENFTMDTGTGINVPKTGNPIQDRLLNRIESSVVNKSGMSYADPQAADAWLKYNTQKAPGGGNWLIPEEMAPRPFTKPIHEIQGPKLPENWSKYQLKLLSGGYTPADILQILRQRQNGQET